MLKRVSKGSQDSNSGHPGFTLIGRVMTRFPASGDAGPNIAQSAEKMRSLSTLGVERVAFGGPFWLFYVE